MDISPIPMARGRSRSCRTCSGQAAASTAASTAPSAMNAQEMLIYAAMAQVLFLDEPALHELRLIVAKDVRRVTGRSGHGPARLVRSRCVGAGDGAARRPPVAAVANSGQRRTRQARMTSRMKSITGSGYCSSIGNDRVREREDTNLAHNEHCCAFRGTGVAGAAWVRRVTASKIEFLRSLFAPRKL